MSLLVVGISHHSASIDLLDRVALTESAAASFRDAVAASPFVSESMVVATCNRLEVIAEIDRFHGAVGDITEQMAAHCGVAEGMIASHQYAHFEDDAVRHVFRVAAGLDSMVVGEQQVVGQVRAALRAAQRAGTAGRHLNSVAQRALRVGKRVRTDTGVGRHGTSLVSVALSLAADELGGLRGRAALVVGAGAMSSLAVSGLAAAGVGRISIANRTDAAAERLAATHGARPVGMEAVADEIVSVDLVVAATGAKGLVITRDTVAAVAASRRGRPLVVVDLAVPHDTDPSIADLDAVTRIDLSQMAAVPRLQASVEDLLRAGRVIDEEVRLFLVEKAVERVQPVLVSMRATAGVVVEAELARLRAAVPELSDEEIGAVGRAMRRAVSTLLHAPTVRMKELAANSDGERIAEALGALVDLDVDRDAKKHVRVD